MQKYFVKWLCYIYLLSKELPKTDTKGNTKYQYTSLPTANNFQQHMKDEGIDNSIILKQLAGYITVLVLEKYNIQAAHRGD